MKFQLEYLTVSISRDNPILHISLQGHHDVTLNWPPLTSQDTQCTYERNI